MIRNSNIPDGSGLGPGEFLESGHLVHVQVKDPNGLSFTRHQGEKGSLK